MSLADDSVFATTASRALNIVANALIVVRRAPCVTITTDGSAAGQSTHRLLVVLEDGDGFLAAPCHDLGAIAAGQELVRLQPAID